jgi:hypothetical protein
VFGSKLGGSGQGGSGRSCGLLFVLVVFFHALRVLVGRLERELG